MLFLILFTKSLFTAFAVFLFTLFWFSKFMFGYILHNLRYKNNITQNTKNALVIEFCSSVLLSIAIVVVFGGLTGFNALVYGMIIGFSTVIPFAISFAVWMNLTFKQFCILSSHRIWQILIAFMVSGLLNEVLYAISS